MHVVIERTEPKPGDTHRFGTLRANGFSCFTLEWPESGGAYKCLPSGEYRLTLGEHHPGTKKAYACYHISNDEVPLSRQFEIHVGNMLHDSKGCVLVGTEMGTSFGEPAVLRSRLAHEAFMATMNGVQESTLVIMYAIPSPNLDTGDATV